MNIFYVANIDLSEEGAPTQHVFEVCENLIKLGHKVTLFVPDKGGYQHETSVQIVEIPTPGVPFLFPFLFQMGLFFYLISFSLRSKPDIIYTRSTTIGIAQELIKALFGVPLVTEINGKKPDEARMNGAPEWKIRLISFFERRFYRVSDKLIAVTSGLKDWLIDDYKIPPDKISVIPNGADVKVFKPMDQRVCQEELGFNEDSLYVCFVGMLQVWQGLEYLIEAAPYILVKIPNVKFLIVGDGVARNRLMELVNSKGLKEHFVFTGQVAHQQVPVYINACDICVAPYIRGKMGFSLKLLEYMACGKPVITSINFQPIENCLAGIIVEPEKPSALADSLMRLLRNEGLREIMGRNGRELVVREFTWESVVRKVEAVCLEAAQSAHRAH